MQNTSPKIGRHITYIRLENFQNHKDTEINIQSGIVLIVGSSDVGKSAITRAINFVFHNLPRGNNFIRHGAGKCCVTIKFSDGTMIQRIKGVNEKGESENDIIYKSANGQEEKFASIDKKIPPKIIKALGNPPIDVKHGPIAYAEQMGPLFLVGLGNADLPRALSELIGIDN